MHLAGADRRASAVRRARRAAVPSRRFPRRARARARPPCPRRPTRPRARAVRRARATPRASPAPARSAAAQAPAAPGRASARRPLLAGRAWRPAGQRRPRAQPLRDAAPPGSCSRRTATFRPIPSTAQPCCGRPSTRMPASFASSRPAPGDSTTMSFGHLIRALAPRPPRTRPPPRRAAAAAARRAAPATSAASCRAGADQRRPCRPRPAVCSEAVTSVPCGAPANGELACALVGRARAPQMQRAGGRALTPRAPSSRRRDRRRAASRPSRG